MRVKDIPFENAEHVIEEIKHMNVKGGSEIACGFQCDINR